MKLLLTVSSLEHIQNLSAHYSAAFQQDSSLSFLYSGKILHHEVDVVITGTGLFQTSYKVTKTLSKQKYHLALKVGLGNSYNKDIACGTVLNIINEKPGDLGMMVNKDWKDAYDLGLIERNDEPHVRGGFINLTNAYMNAFMPFKKVVGVTVSHYGDKDSHLMRKEKYKADCETGDGLGFVYPCLYEKQAFYQLCVIESNLATGETDINRARTALDETLIDLISKL
jgi:futalosine hydrolase